MRLKRSAARQPGQQRQIVRGRLAVRISYGSIHGHRCYMAQQLAAAAVGGKKAGMVQPILRSLWGARYAPEETDGIDGRGGLVWSGRNTKKPIRAGRKSV